MYCSKCKKRVLTKFNLIINTLINKNGLICFENIYVLNCQCFYYCRKIQKMFPIKLTLLFYKLFTN